MTIVKVPVFATEIEIKDLRQFILDKDWDAALKHPAVFRFLQSVEQERWDEMGKVTDE